MLGNVEGVEQVRSVLPRLGLGGGQHRVLDKGIETSLNLSQILGGSLKNFAHWVGMSGFESEEVHLEQLMQDPATFSRVDKCQNQK